MASSARSAARARLAQPHEAETVARLLVEFRNHLGARRPSDNAVLAGVERLIEAMETEYLLASADDDSPPSGVAQIRYRFGIWRAAPDAWLEDLFVSAPARRRGVGAALVEGALERARLRGCRRIELDVNEANAPARALYERFGFSTHSKHGQGRDLFLGRGIEPAEER